MKVSTNYNNILNWNIALGLKEISDYLEKPELNQLSLINRNLRSKLRSKLFHDINITYCPHNLVKHLDNSIQAQDTVKEKAQEFIEEISSITPYVNGFTCDELTSVYLLYPVFSTFTQLKSVRLHYFFISVHNLKIILKSSDSLEKLELNRISAVGLNGASIINSITLPKTLKKLTIYNCRMFESTLKDDHMNYNINIYDHSYEMFKIFIFKNFLLPNLESLSLSGYLDFDTKRINNILTNAQYLKSFELEGRLINQDTINILINLNYLEELSLFDDWDHFGDIEYIPWQIDIPIFRKLKTLSIKCVVAYKLFKNYITSFPNLTKLKLYYNPEAIDYFLKRLNIKKLTISCKYQEKFDVKISSNSIESIEIATFSPQVIDFISFSSCSNLKILKIIPMNANIGNVSFEEVQEYYRNIDGWKSKLSSDSIICYKV